MKIIYEDITYDIPANSLYVKLESRFDEHVTIIIEQLNGINIQLSAVYYELDFNSNTLEIDTDKLSAHLVKCNRYNLDTIAKV